MPSQDSRSPLEVVTEFVRRAETYSDTVFVGIDPGTTGAIAFRCNKAYCVIDIPVIITKRKKTRTNSAKRTKKTGKKSRTVMSEDRQFDLPAIKALFLALKSVKPRVKVILEKVPITQGPGRLYADVVLNRAYAMWPLFLCQKGYEVFERKALEWKTRMGLLDKDKEDSRQKAIALFPSADILRKKDHNRAEALLLVEALRRELFDGKRKSKV